MGKLTGQTIAASYDQLLIVDDANGISGSLQAIESADTDGSASSLKISTSKVEVIPASNSTSLFEVSNAAGTPVLSVDTSNARVGINTDSPDYAFEVEASGTFSKIAQTVYRDSDKGNYQDMFYSRGTVGSPAVVQENDELFTLRVFGYNADGTAFDQAAAIIFSVDGEPSSSSDSSDMPGRIEFWTTPNASETPAEAMRIEADNTVVMNGALQPAGNVTIASDLTVNGGDVTISNSSGHANLNIDANADEGADSAIAFRSGTTERGYIYYDHNTTAASQKMVFNVGDNAVTAMTILGNGNMGIGTTSINSNAKLHISGGNSGQTSSSNNTQLTIENSGTAGIQLLTGTSNVGGLWIGDSNGSETGGKLYYSNNDDSWQFYNGGSTNSLNITSGGNVLIGDTANANTTIGLTINQGANDNEAFALKSSDVAHGMTDLTETDTYFSLAKASASQGGVNAQAFSDNTEYAWYMQGATLASANTAKSTSGVGVITMASATKTGTNRTTVTSDGNLVVMKNDSLTRFIFDGEGSGHADVEWTTYSDGRLKTDRETIPYGLDEINKLKPQRYKKQSGGFDKDGNMVLEDNKKIEIGFIAQEVKEIIPELVKDIDESESFYSLNDGKIVAVLVKAVQELSAKVEALENA